MLPQHRAALFSQTYIGRKESGKGILEVMEKMKVCGCVSACVCVDKTGQEAGKALNPKCEQRDPLTHLAYDY